MSQWIDIFGAGISDSGTSQQWVTVVGAGVSEQATSGGNTTTITVTDGIVFLDPTSATNESQRQDALLLGSTPLRDQQTFVFDGVLANDYFSTETVKTLLDALYITDSRSSVVDRLVVDFLYTYDTVTAQSSGTNVTETTIIDYLLLIDGYARDNQATARDSLFFSDAGFSETFRLLLDSVLLDETRRSERSITMLEALLVDTMHDRVIELLQQELLFLNDSVTASRISATAALLRYARLDRNAYLGVSLSAHSWLGEQTAVNDYLGASLSHDQWRVA